MSPGLSAALAAVFRPTPPSGRTSLSLTTQTPLELRGPFRRGSPGDAYFLRNSTAGIFACDSYSADLRTETGADVQVASSSATKVHAMPQGEACVETSLGAAAGSRLVFGPHPIILQGNSSLRQATTVALQPGGVVLLAEILVLGRLSSGEYCEFRRFENGLQVRNSLTGLVYEERYILTPSPELRASLAGRGVIASIYGFGLDDGAAEGCLASDILLRHGLGGCSRLPNAAGAVLRLLADSLSQGLAFSECALARLREPGLGRSRADIGL